jgi:hypothetical protein
MIGSVQPDRIVEVGGGYSTLIARQAVECFGLECEIVVVDPEPRTEVRMAADRVELARVEAGGTALWEGVSRPVAFIDSSHILRSGGDLPFLYGELLPALPNGAVVHVHDVYLPFDYPNPPVDWFWNEQYVLQALLAYSSRFGVVLAVHNLSRACPDQISSLLGGAVASDPRHFGASFWVSVGSVTAEGVGAR